MVNIALISDIHFGKYSRSHELSVPGESIQDDNEGAVSLSESFIDILKNNHVQYLFVAGDLTSVGSPHEFRYFQKEILRITEKAEIPPENIFLGLGNHDVDWKISKLYEDYASLFNTDFPLTMVKEQYQLIAASASKQNMSEISQQITIDGPAPYSGIIEKEEFVAFVLNSGWFCTHDQKYPHGKLSRNQLDWLKENLEKYRREEKWKIVLLHHHPFNYPFPNLQSDISTLEEGSELLDILGKSGVNLVLHGHRHHPRAKTVCETGWIAPITFICAGSFSVNSGHRGNGLIPNTIHIINLSDTVGELRLNNYQYSPTEGWIPMKSNCTETPLDSIMHLGRIFSRTETNNAISSLKPNKLLKWEELDLSLRYLPIDELNNLVERQFSNTYDVVGKFPANTFILEKGELMI